MEKKLRMNPKLFDKKLEYKCIISLEVRGPLFSILSRYGKKISVSLIRVDGTVNLTLFLPRDESSRSLPLSKIAEADQNTNDAFIIINIKLDEKSEINLFRSVIKETSVLVKQIYFKESEIVMEFFFHSSRRYQITEVLNTFNEASAGFKIIYFGPSLSLSAELSELSLSEDVTVVQVSTKISSYSPQIQDLAKKYSDAIFIPELRSRNSRGVRTLVFSPSPIEDKMFTEISKESMIYEFYAWEELLWNSRINRVVQFVPLTVAAFWVRGDRLVDTTLISTHLAQKFIRNYMTLGGTEGNMSQILEFYYQLGPEVWQ